MPRKRSVPRYVYIVFSQTNTRIGRAIRAVTRRAYNHCSLALSPRLEALYSFARLRRSSPLVGGFVVETPARFLDGAENIPVKICRVPLSERKWRRLCRALQRMENASDNKFYYNSYGALGSLLGISVSPQDTYTCVEFVSSLLGYGRIRKLESLEQLLEACVFYEGDFCNFTSARGGADSDYFLPQEPLKTLTETVNYLSRLAVRTAWKGGGH